MLNVVGAYEYDGASDEFCKKHHVRPKVMTEIRKLRAQLTHLMQIYCPGVQLVMDPKMPPPDEQQCRILRQIVAAGFSDQLAVRQDSVARHSTARGVEYRLQNGLEAYIHPSSVLFSQRPPDMIVYSELQQTHKNWMHCLTVVDRDWIK